MAKFVRESSIETRSTLQKPMKRSPNSKHWRIFSWNTIQAVPTTKFALDFASVERVVHYDNNRSVHVLTTGSLDRLEDITDV